MLQFQIFDIGSKDNLPALDRYLSISSIIDKMHLANVFLIDNINNPTSEEATDFYSSIVNKVHGEGIVLKLNKNLPDTGRKSLYKFKCMIDDKFLCTDRKWIDDSTNKIKNLVLTFYFIYQ